MRLNAQRLAKLQAQNLPVLTSAIVNPTIPAGSAEDIAKGKALIALLDAYFSVFTEMKEGNLCINCGMPQGAKDIAHAFLLGAGFRWGLAHGEGYCSGCGYPARAHHFVGDWFTLRGLILQYHPSQIKL